MTRWEYSYDVPPLRFTGKERDGESGREESGRGIEGNRDRESGTGRFLRFYAG